MKSVLTKKIYLSDNCSGVHKNVLDYLFTVNNGDDFSYGDDYFTQKVLDIFKKRLGNTSLSVHFVSSCTAANTLAVKLMLKQHQAVICSDVAHLHLNESRSIQAIAGNQIITVKSKFGKIKSDDILPILSGIGNLYLPQPKLLSITQPTEYGTVYTLSELESIKNVAKKHDLLLHMDGARIANAISYLNCNIKEICDDFDVITFGNVKNGAIFGDALIFSNKNIIKDSIYTIKQNMQLIPKSRYIAAQFLAMFNDDLWLKNASHANSMTQILAEKLSRINFIKLETPIETNTIFLKMPAEKIVALSKKISFSIVDYDKGIIRIVVSFDTTIDQINELIALFNKI